jgi:hypothetical protein
MKNKFDVHFLLKERPYRHAQLRRSKSMSAPIAGNSV